MLTYFTSNSPQKRWNLSFVVGLLCLIAPLNSTANNPGIDNSTVTSNGNSPSAWFSLLEMKPVGDLLYFTYKIRYPGMTKVRLYEGDSEEPVWRGQYVNQKEGVYTVRFKTTMLKSGQQYRFEFDYKNHIVPRFYTP